MSLAFGMLLLVFKFFGHVLDTGKNNIHKNSMDLEERNLKKGIQLFKRQQYDESISLFLSVIHAYQDDFNKKRKKLEKEIKSRTDRRSAEEISYNKNYVNALDCLSASYIKVGNPEKALKYARIMLRLQPLGCKGYLRLSKVHTAMKNNEKAFEILKKGYLRIREAKNNSTKKVVVNESLYLQLKDELKKHKSLLAETDASNTEVISTKNTDPLKVLPLELISSIFVQFPLTFNLRCLNVSSHWFETLTNASHVFENFQLKKNIRKQEFTQFLKFLGKIHRHNNGRVFLKSINIEPHESVEKSILSLLFSRDLIIENLKINLNSTNLYGLDPFMKKGNKSFLRLKSLNLRIPLLTTENITLEKLLKLCENLEKLVLIIPKFDSRSIENRQKITFYPNLRFLSLSVEKEAAVSTLNFTLLNTFLTQNLFPNLEHLTVSRVKLNVETLRLIVNPSLQSVELDSVPGISIATVLDAMLEKAPEVRSGVLRELKVVETETIMDSSHREWKNDLLRSKILSNLNVFMLRNSCVTPSLLDDILLGSTCQIKSLHLVLNRYLMFQNRLSNPRSTQTPYEYANISKWLMKIPNIEELSIVGCPGFNQLTMIELANQALTNHLFDKLFYLNLSMNKIDNSSLIQLFRKPYNLKLDKLVIQYCEVSPDTVRFLLDNKICKSVDYKMSDRVVL